MSLLREELRKRRREAERRRLVHVSPTVRNLTAARVALAGAVEMLERDARRTRNLVKAVHLRAAGRHVAEALRELEAADGPTPGWVPRWPAP